MANGSGLVQRGPLPPLNSPTISEADRGRVYGAIGKELNNILNGPASHHSDSVKRSSNDLRSELNDFIDAVKSLKNALSDPANIVDDAVRDLEVFRKAFEAGVSNDIETMWNDSKDERDKGVKLPDRLVPFTRDNRIIDPEPTPGPFSVPNPLSPDQWRKDLRASTGSPDVEAASAADSYPQLARRVTRFAPGTSPMTTKQLPPSPEPSRPLGLLTGKPMSLSPFQLPLDGLSDNSNASGNNDSFNLMAGLVSQNPAPPAPPLQAGAMAGPQGRQPIAGFRIRSRRAGGTVCFL
jgi:hypothetical protein